MKFQFFGALLALLTCCHAPALAQNAGFKEPQRSSLRLFHQLPEKQTLRLHSLQALLDLPVGASVNTTVATNFLLKGTVVGKSDPGDAKVQSVIVRSTSHGGAVLTFSRVVRHDGTIAYTGRMLSRTAADALEFVKEGTTYVVRKKDYHDMVNE